MKWEWRVDEVIQPVVLQISTGHILLEGKRWSCSSEAFREMSLLIRISIEKLGPNARTPLWETRPSSAEIRVYFCTFFCMKKSLLLKDRISGWRSSFLSLRNRWPILTDEAPVWFAERNDEKKCDCSVTAGRCGICVCMLRKHWSTQPLSQNHNMRTVSGSVATERPH